MINVSQVVEVFKREKLAHITLGDYGSIVISCAGCLHDQDWIYEYGASRTVISPQDGTEVWTISPDADKRAELVEGLIGAWKAMQEPLAPGYRTWLDFNSFAQPFDPAAWGEYKPSAEQLRTLLSLCQVGRKVRVYHNQEEAHASTWGGSTDITWGWLGVQVDEKLWLLSISGYLHLTSVNGLPID